MCKLTDTSRTSSWSARADLTPTGLTVTTPAGGEDRLPAGAGGPPRLQQRQADYLSDLTPVKTTYDLAKADCAIHYRRDRNLDDRSRCGSTAYPTRRAWRCTPTGTGVRPQGRLPRVQGAGRHRRRRGRRRRPVVLRIEGDGKELKYADVRPQGQVQGPGAVTAERQGRAEAAHHRPPRRPARATASTWIWPTPM